MKSSIKRIFDKVVVYLMTSW